MTERDEPRRLTDQDRINHGIRKAEDEARPIDAVTARIIASHWHGGQFSAMYSFVSTGRIKLDLLLPELLSEFTGVITDQDRQELDMLAEYLSASGDREAVEGWHESTKWGDVGEIDRPSGGDRG